MTTTYAPGMSPVNSNLPPFTPIGLAFSGEEPGGYIPETGVYSVRRWSQFFNVDPQTIRRWIKVYRIPYRKPGAEIYVDALDLLKHVPYFGDDGDE